MSEQGDEHPRDDNRNEEIDGTPIPDPEEEQGTAADDPQATDRDPHGGACVA